MAKPYRLYSIIIFAYYILYVIVYFKTRTVTDRAIAIDPDIFVRLWYFLAYPLTPFSKRIIQITPAILIPAIKAIKVLVTVAIIPAFLYAFARGGKWMRFFIFWYVLSISTITIFDWNIGLFTLYPEKTASRFMYGSIPALAVLAAWFYSMIITKFDRYRYYGIIRNLLVIIFILINFVAVYKVSGLFLRGQKFNSQIVENLKSILTETQICDTLVVINEEIENSPQLIQSGVFLEAILYVKFNKRLTVEVRERLDSLEIEAGHVDNWTVLNWNNQTNTLLLHRR